jgi:hypothetical protein
MENGKEGLAKAVQLRAQLMSGGAVKPVLIEGRVFRGTLRRE